MRGAASANESSSSDNHNKNKAEEETNNEDDPMEVDPDNNDNDDSEDKKESTIPTWDVESESSDEEDGVDYFAAFSNTFTSKSKSKKKRTAVHKRSTSTTSKPLIAIKLMTTQTKKVEQEEKSSQETTKVPEGRTTSTDDFEFRQQLELLLEEEDRLLQEDYDGDDALELDSFEDSLNFFSVPHEDQDPNFVLFQKEQRRTAYAEGLKQLKVQEQEGVERITQLVKSQMRERQTATEQTVEKYHSRIDAEERRDLQRLQQSFHEKNASNQAKINQGIGVLRQRHAKEHDKLRGHHQQQAQQAQLPQNVAAQQWDQVMSRLQAKQNAQVQNFLKKGEEFKQRVEQEMLRDQETIRATHKTRRNEIVNNRRTMYTKIASHFQMQLQRYLKRHYQKVHAAKEQLNETYRDLLQGEDEKDKKDKDEKETSKTKVESSTKAKEESQPSASSPSPSLSFSPPSSHERPELYQPEPCKIECNWQPYSSHAKSGAAARHKHRKAVLSQLNRQLSVEIHNEGMWISTIIEVEKPGKDADENAKKKYLAAKADAQKKQVRHFMPWGVKAREILGSIICGEIPADFGAEGFEFTDTSSPYGSHVRCVMTDWRTSEETASNLRAASVHEYEVSSLADLEKKAGDMANLSKNAEKSLAKVEAEEKTCALKAEDSAKEVEKMRNKFVEFRTKFAKYLGPDGNPLPSNAPSDKQKLLKAINQYKTNLDAATKRSSAAAKQLADAKAQSAKYQAMVKQAQKAAVLALSTLKKKKTIISESKRGPRSKGSEIIDLERANVRVKDVIAVLHVTAERRREELQKKRSNSNSQALGASLPGVPAALKKSLWHKMHRRRQQIVLRPSFESLLVGLGKSVSDSLSASKRYIGREATEEFHLKAEQRFLQVAHPVLPSNSLSSIPTGDPDSWAEPGWHVDLSVPKQKTGTLLPCPPSFPLLERNICEMSSAPGRQAASLIRDADLRCLTSHISAVATATSLAETDPSVAARKGGMFMC